MEGYKINGTPLSDFGITESQIPGGNVALEGAWDMPSRIGKVFHDWGDENGIEPYLRQDEIFFGGRDIKFYGFMKMDSREQIIEKLDQFYSIIDSDTLLELSSDLGIWNVYVSSEVDVTYHYADDLAEVQFNFREPAVDFPEATFPVEDFSIESIDNYSWESLGVILLSLEKDLNRPAIKQMPIISYGSERFSGAKRSFRTISFKGVIVQSTYSKFKTVLNRLYKLFSKPNARTLKMPDGTVREIFLKDGFRVYNVTIEDNEVIAELEISISEISQLQDWNKLTDNEGLTLVDKYGQPFTEIIKKF